MSSKLILNIKDEVSVFTKLFPHFRFFETVEQAGSSKRERTIDNERAGVIPIDIRGTYTGVEGSILTITHSLSSAKKLYEDAERFVKVGQRSFPKGGREEEDIVAADLYCKIYGLKCEKNSLHFIHIVDAFNASRELYEETGIEVTADALLSLPFCYSDRYKYFILPLANEIVSYMPPILSSTDDSIDSYQWIDYRSIRQMEYKDEDKEIYSSNASFLVRKMIKSIFKNLYSEKSSNSEKKSGSAAVRGAAGLKITRPTQ